MHEADRAVQQPDLVDVMGGNLRGAVEPELRRAILAIELEQNAEPTILEGDDYRLEYDDDGYPKLPACLDRRA